MFKKKGLPLLVPPPPTLSLVQLPADVGSAGARGPCASDHSASATEMCKEWTEASALSVPYPRAERRRELWPVRRTERRRRAKLSRHAKTQRHTQFSTPHHVPGRCPHTFSFKLLITAFFFVEQIWKFRRFPICHRWDRSSLFVINWDFLCLSFAKKKRNFLCLPCHCR
jgi:hypothetical protein